MADSTASPLATVLVVGATGSGRHALAQALAQRVPSDALRISVIEGVAALPQALPLNSQILLLAPRDAAGEADDLRWRRALNRAPLPYSVLHGSASARLEAAWALLPATAPTDAPPEPSAAPAGGWSWRCDKCSDPACEHRLFRDLLARREPAAPASY